MMVKSKICKHGQGLALYLKKEVRENWDVEENETVKVDIIEKEEHSGKVLIAVRT